MLYLYLPRKVSQAQKYMALVIWIMEQPGMAKYTVYVHLQLDRPL
jgi:hypothetical protein